MSPGPIGLLLAHELRLVLRDRRAVVAACVLPLVIVPATLLAVRLSSDRLEQQRGVAVYRYAVVGPAAGELGRALEELQPGAEPASQARLMQVPVGDPQAALRQARIDVLLEASAPRRLRIHYLGDSDVSKDAAARVEALLRAARFAGAEAGLRRQGIFLDTRRAFPVEATDVATPADRGGAAVGRLLTALVVFLMLSGAAGAALDMVAGERERGTLETLLTTAAPRSAIVAAKHLAVLAIALASAAIQVGSLLAWLSLGLVRLPPGFAVPVSAATLPALLLLFLPLAALVAATLLLVSGRVGSFREAQLFLLPLFLGALAPALASFLPGVPLRSALVVVPVAGPSLAVREVLAGRFDWPLIVLAAGTTAAAAAWVTGLSTRALSDEERLLRGTREPAPPGSSAAFEARVGAWFAAMWALLFLASGLLTRLRPQLLFNQLVVFLGVPWVVSRRYGLPLRELFALRPVRPPVLLAALLAIAPGVVVAQGVFRLASRLLPVSSGMLQELSRALLPQDLSAPEAVVLMALLPAVCEELAFRGALLYGLRRRLHPAFLALTAGAVFGFFHFAYFRLAPTAFLGVLLASLVLLTGSVFPGMLLHAGHNSLTLWAGQQGFPLDSLDPWLYAVSAAALALCFWIVYRCRTPYPGLRPWRRRRVTA